MAGLSHAVTVQLGHSDDAVQMATWRPEDGRSTMEIYYHIITIKDIYIYSHRYVSTIEIIPRHFIYTLWLFNIAMENGPFIDSNLGLPIKNGDFPWLC
jgi:hypothetical protein